MLSSAAREHFNEIETKKRKIQIILFNIYSVCDTLTHSPKRLLGTPVQSVINAII